MTCWGQFGIYGQQLRGTRPPGEAIFSYTAIGKGYFGGVTYCGIFADGDFKGAARCYGRAFPLDSKELTVSEKSDARLVECQRRTQAVLSFKQYVFRSLQVGGLFACGMVYDTTSPTFNPNYPDPASAELMCWGDHSSAQCDVPPATTDYGNTFIIKYVDYSLGFDHACALRNDNRVVCWGNNIEGQATVPNADAVMSKQLGVGISASADRDWVLVSAGWSHTCGLKASGQIVCWGSNNWGQAAVPAGTVKYVTPFPE